VIGYFARNWIRARIEKGVQHGFDVKIEALRAELRKAEEKFKSELRDKEAEIATLRSNVLAGSASRQALLDKRRFEAVEKIWAAVNEHSKLKHLAATVALLKHNEVAKRANDPKMQELLSIFGVGMPKPDDMPSHAPVEQLYVPTLVWAYFSAYTTVLRLNIMIFRLVQIGETDLEKIISVENIKAALRGCNTAPSQVHRRKRADSLLLPDR
jgi:hypothetical protein